MYAQWELALNPYLSLGLERNPFANCAEPNGSDRFWLDRGWSDAPKIRAKQVVQIIAPKGFGKTSHLQHWRSQTSGPYCYYPAGLGRFKLPPIGPIVYWDEADRIPLPLLLTALMGAAIAHSTVVMGTHADLGQFAQFVGLAVETIHLAPLSVETLMEWSRLKIKAVQLPHRNCQLVLDKNKARDIIKSANGSWRSATDYLHIWVATTAYQQGHGG